MRSREIEDTVPGEMRRQNGIHDGIGSCRSTVAVEHRHSRQHDRNTQRDRIPRGSALQDGHALVIRCLRAMRIARVFPTLRPIEPALRWSQSFFRTVCINTTIYCADMAAPIHWVGLRLGRTSTKIWLKTGRNLKISANYLDTPRGNGAINRTSGIFPREQQQWILFPAIHRC